MRTIIPAIAIVIAVCLSAQAHLSEWQFNRAAVEHQRQLRAAWTSGDSVPTSQPSTQPIGTDEPARAALGGRRASASSSPMR